MKANRRLSIRNYLLVHAASGKPAVSGGKSGYQASIEQFGNIRKRPFTHKNEKKLEELEIDNECKLKEDKPKKEIGLSIKSCNNEIHSETKACLSSNFWSIEVLYRRNPLLFIGSIKEN